MRNVDVYVLVGPTESEELGVCGFFLDAQAADRAAGRAPDFYGVATHVEQYRVVELELGTLLASGALNMLMGL